MKIKAQVKFINHRKGMIAALTDDGEYLVFELIGGYNVDVGDIISGPLESLGGETFLNETSGEWMDVYVQGIHCTKPNAMNLVGMD